MLLVLVFDGVTVKTINFKIRQRRILLRNQRALGASSFIASHADILLARHAIFPPQRGGGLRDERVTSPKKACVGGYNSSFMYDMYT